MVERCVRDAEVVGSNPVASTLGRGNPGSFILRLPGFFCAALSQYATIKFSMTEMSYYDDTERLQLMKAVSMERPVCAMEDESAIFIRDGKADIIGVIHRIDKGEIGLFTEEDVLL